MLQKYADHSQELKDVSLGAQGPSQCGSACHLTCLQRPCKRTSVPGLVQLGAIAWHNKVQFIDSGLKMLGTMQG